MFEIRKRQIEKRVAARSVPREVEPFFAALLVAAATFMAVLLLGSGSILAGLLFATVPALAVVLAWKALRARK